MAATGEMLALDCQHHRIDYKRVDGKGYAANWRTWYPDVFGAPTKVVADPGMAYAKAKPFSKAWPFDFHYNATTSAPANHTVRYQDSHIDLLEVAIRPGETEHMHGHPYASVYADDGGSESSRSSSPKAQPRGSFPATVPSTTPSIPSLT